MTTIYDASILLVDDNPDLLTLVTDNLRTTVDIFKQDITNGIV